MRRQPDDFRDLLVHLAPGELVLDHALAMELPAGWNHVSGGSQQPPPLDGVTSFVELSDDEVVVTVLTRDYRYGPDRLLDEITGQGIGDDDSSTNYCGLHLRRNVHGRARCDRDEFEELFIAALIVEPQDNEPAGRIGVEVVAAGPVGAITERLPMLRSMVSTIGRH